MRALYSVPGCRALRVPAQVSPVPLEEPTHQNPVLLGGVCERAPSLFSRHRVASLWAAPG